MAAEADLTLNEVLGKIDAGTVTCEDLNTLIQKSLTETNDASIVDRVRRITSKPIDPLRSHIEPETGHQDLKPIPNIHRNADPKLKPEHPMSHGRSKIGHDHSARTQARKAKVKKQTPLRFKSSFEFIEKNVGKPLTEEILATVPDKIMLRTLVSRFISRPNVNRDWFYELLQKLS